LTPSKGAADQTAALEALAAAAGAEVVAAELLAEFLVAVDDPAAPLDVRLAQGSLDAASTSPRKESLSSWDAGRKAHLLTFMHTAERRTMSGDEFPVARPRGGQDQRR